MQAQRLSALRAKMRPYGKVFDGRACQPIDLSIKGHVRGRRDTSATVGDFDAPRKREAPRILASKESLEARGYRL